MAIFGLASQKDLDSLKDRVNQLSNGKDGLSAYQIWINLGNRGTPEDFIASLKGPKGDQGIPGPQGPPGTSGPDTTTVSALVKSLLMQVPPPISDVPGTPVHLGADIKALVDAVPVDGSAVFKIDAGDYVINDTIRWKNKSIWLIGTNGTRFIFPNGKTGIIIDRDRSIPRNRIENIHVITYGEKFNPKANGIEVHSITDIYNVFVKNFGGKGIAYIADIASSTTDVSNSILFKPQVAECGSDGIYFQGGDANACTIISPDVRDCGGWGIYDHSFLGNYFLGHMTHNNALGGACSDDPNARSVFVAPYNEGGQPVSKIGGAGRVYGGISGNGAHWEAISPWAKIDQQ